jgi:pseudouridylate synthase
MPSRPEDSGSDWPADAVPRKHAAPVLAIAPEVAAALNAKRAVVALESTLIAHGFPWPLNLETAREAEAAVRSEGAVPATIAVWQGRPTVGLDQAQLESLARDPDVIKASRRDLAFVISQGRTAATTVAATMFLAHLGGIRLLATGGIGGVHRGAGETFDISADLMELARTPVCVICSGGKSILDIPKTLEVLETQGVPVIGYGTDEFPAFYLKSSGEKLDAQVDAPDQAARLLQTHWTLRGAGVVLAQPPPAEMALRPEAFTVALELAEKEAAMKHVKGKALTPFLLARLAQHTEGKTLAANHALIVENARLAAKIAIAF